MSTQQKLPARLRSKSLTNGFLANSTTSASLQVTSEGYESDVDEVDGDGDDDGDDSDASALLTPAHPGEVSPFAHHQERFLGESESGVGGFDKVAVSTTLSGSALTNPASQSSQREHHYTSSESSSSDSESEGEEARQKRLLLLRVPIQVHVEVEVITSE